MALFPKSKAKNTFQFMGYQIPIDLIMLTGGGTDNFDAISSFHIKNIQRWVGLEADHTVLEIGCGIGRDAIPLTKILRNGQYFGIDIIKRSIDWCSQNITKKTVTSNSIISTLKINFITAVAFLEPRI